MIALTLLSKLESDPANPRRGDIARMALVKLSLCKLGFVLPVYATSSGIILSGHQRVAAARAMGWTHAPVAIVDNKDRIAINLLANRATNDLAINDYRHDNLDVEALLIMGERLPDALDLYPCIATHMRQVLPLAVRHADKLIDYAGVVTASLSRRGIKMPLVIDSSGNVINGLGRLQHAAETAQEEIACVTIPADKADFARQVLNRLSMDFDLSIMGDDLRHNARRRARLKRVRLGSGFVFGAFSGSPKRFDLKANKDRWVQAYGQTVLDFGAGHGDEARLLRKHGISVTTFEPFPCCPGKDTLDPARGRRSARTLLDVVASGKPFDSIVLSSVLNSVPFPEDRAHIITICAALCGPGTTLFAAARSRGDPNWRGVINGGVISSHGRGLIAFPSSAEDGTILGDLAEPKMQKYFGMQEFYRLFKQRFATVQVGRHMNNAVARCVDPLPVDPVTLRTALKFEFDLPYPGGRRMGLADKALEAFSARLRVQL